MYFSNTIQVSESSQLDLNIMRNITSSVLECNRTQNLLVRFNNVPSEFISIPWPLLCQVCCKILPSRFKITSATLITRLHLNQGFHCLPHIVTMETRNNWHATVNKSLTAVNNALQTRSQSTKTDVHSISISFWNYICI